MYMLLLLVVVPCNMLTLTLRCFTELPLLHQYLSEFVLNIIFSTATM